MKRIVNITVKPIVMACTGTIWFTDLMLQEGAILSRHVINTETAQKEVRDRRRIRPHRKTLLQRHRPQQRNLHHLQSRQDLDRTRLEDLSEPEHEGRERFPMPSTLEHTSRPLLMPQTPVTNYRFSRQRDSALRTALPPRRMDSSSTPQPETASTLLRSRRRNQRCCIVCGVSGDGGWAKI